MSSSPLIPDKNSVQEHLQTLLRSTQFTKAPTLARLLEFIVTTTLAEQELKERTIGVAVFSKPLDYDTVKDSIVRVNANRVRDRLKEFYEIAGTETAIRIEIPTGAYTPNFLVSHQTLPATVDTPTDKVLFDPEECPTVSQFLVTDHMPPPPFGVVPDKSVEGETFPATSHVPVTEKVPSPISAIARDTVFGDGVRFPAARLWTWLTVTCAAVGLAVAGTFVLVKKNPTAEQVTSIPLTRDGRAKTGPLFTDGVNIYFREAATAGHLMLTVVPIAGGNATPVSIALREPVEVRGVLDKRSSFLLVGPDSQSQLRFWNWTPNQSLEPLESTTENSIRITKSIQAEARRDGHLILRDNDRSDREVPVPGIVNHLSWHRDPPLLRFTVTDSGTDRRSIWEMQDLKGSARPLYDFPKDGFDGHWNVSGDIFTFLSRGNGESNSDIADIWMADSRRATSIEHPTISRLTHGPISYEAPIAAPDGRTVVAFGVTHKPELVRYDSKREGWIPYLDGTSTFETDFSRDGHWIAYVQYPERTLWKVRTDGKERTQLTFAPFQAIQPQWSPDGKHIALMGLWPGGHHQVYLVPGNGGPPEALFAQPDGQGIPTWSADGTHVVFGDILSQGPPSEMRVHVVNIHTRGEVTLPSPNGIWTPRWSPDGRFIAALSADSKEIVLYDVQSNRWRVLATCPFIESPAWTIDSKQIYFRMAGQDAAQSKEANRRFFLQRIDVDSGKVIPVADITELEISNTAWFGLTPQGEPLALRNTRTTDLYSISVPR